tara:strand:+ start:290 stop:1339 length:1050 start_codon:yes stop_codon:yes gene_type:complete
MFIFSDKNIEALSLKNQHLFHNLVDISKLNKRWNKDKFLEIEIKKSFVRGELRYSKIGLEIANKINEIVNENNILNEYNFFTNIYPMIHLSGDLSEKSHLHFDQHDDNDIFTCWLTITNNSYNPISLLKFNNKKLKRILAKIPFPDFFLKELDPKIGFLNIWDGHNLHRGNLNISSNISCAYQLKFSKNKYIFDFSCKKDSIINNNMNSNTNDYSENLKKFTDLILSLDEVNFKNYKFDNIFSIIESILKRKFSKKNEKISFSLSILAQRLLIHGNKFNVHNYEMKVLLLDICSILLGSENLISLDRLCKRFLQNNIKKIDILYNSDFLNCIPKANYEWTKILKNNNYE